MPSRTCIGCRGVDERSALRRFVAQDGVLVPDERKVLPGRGCWLHDNPECVRLALKRRAFARALRGAVVVPEKLFD